MILKLLHVILLASIKYFVSLPYAMIIGLDFKQALTAVLIGGIGGFLFFYYLSKQVLKMYYHLKPKICRLIPERLKLKYHVFCKRISIPKSKIKFSRKSRFFVRFKTTYGFWGVIIATPFLLSIPIGAFLANKYYSKRPQTVPYMILSILGWTVVLSGIVHIFPRVFF